MRNPFNRSSWTPTSLWGSRFRGCDHGGGGFRRWRRSPEASDMPRRRRSLAASSSRHEAIQLPRRSLGTAALQAE